MRKQRGLCKQRRPIVCWWFVHHYLAHKNVKTTIQSNLAHKIESYIFNDKWKSLDPHNQDIFTFPRPRNRRNMKEKYHFREIGIDKYNGPWNINNEYRLDVTFWDYPDPYTESLENILAEDIDEIHEHIAYHYVNYGGRFIQYWRGVCRLQSIPEIPAGSILFADHKYIYNEWRPPPYTLYCYPGYEQSIAICGGKQIDTEFEYKCDGNSRIHFVNDNIWYISNGESFQIITSSRNTNTQILYIKNHQIQEMRRVQELERSKLEQQSLNKHLSRIYGKLKLKKDGEPFGFRADLYASLWPNYLQNALKQLNINITSTRSNPRKKKWSMLLSEANLCFGCNEAKDRPYFQRYYNTANKDIVYLSNMRFAFNTYSGCLTIQAMMLRRDSSNCVYGMQALKNKKDYYSLETVMSISVMYIILDYLNDEELQILKNVSMSSYILSNQKYDCKTHDRFIKMYQNHLNEEM